MAVKKDKKAKTIVMKRNVPLKKVQVQDLHRQSGNFSTHLVSRLTGLNTANQNHLNEFRRFQFKHFVQWPRVFLTSNLWSGRHITEKNPAIFPYYKLSGLCFSLRLPWKKKKETPRRHCKNCRDFISNRRRRNVWKALAMLWNSAWNFLIMMPWQKYLY